MLNKFKLIFSFIFLLSSLSNKKIDSSLETQSINNNIENINLNLNYKDLYNDVIDGVVRIINYTSTTSYGKTQYTKQSFGSGFFYDEDLLNYYLLTNYHVISDYKMVSITTSSNQEIQKVGVIGFDKEQDVAVLMVPKTSLKSTIKILDLNKNGDEFLQPSIGDDVIAIGCPAELSFQGTLTKGVVSGLNRIVVCYDYDIFDQSHAIQTDCAINPGNSGGPLLNSDGKVLGINTLKLGNSDDLQYESLNFSLPIEDMYKTASLIRKEYTNQRGNYTISYTSRLCLSTIRRYVSISELNLRERTSLGLENLCSGVVLCEDDETLNLNKGSVICSIDGININNVVEFRKYFLNQLYLGNEDKIVNVGVYKNNNNKLSNINYMNCSLVKFNV